MSLQERERVLSAYRGHAERFTAIAAKRARRSSASESNDMADRPIRRETSAELRQETSAKLSARETAVLTLMASGWSNGEVGARLLISEETVKTHVRHVLAKLRARNRAHAVALAFRRGLITDAESDRPNRAGLPSSCGERLATTSRSTPKASPAGHRPYP